MGQGIGDELRRTALLATELRVGVQVAPHLDQPLAVIGQELCDGHDSSPAGTSLRISASRPSTTARRSPSAASAALRCRR